VHSAESNPAPTIAVILPVLNEATLLPACLAKLIEQQQFDEIIVVDGSSTDASADVVRERIASGVGEQQTCPQLIQSPRGRARQMQAGADTVKSDIMFFLHADTELPTGIADHVREAIHRGYFWGHFDVRLSGRHAWFRIVERLMNWRARLSGIATGDQGIFVRSDVFRVVGGFPQQALMEDIELSTRLKWFGRPACLPGPLTTSSRRWEQNGIFRTVLLMWFLRGLYAFGVSPARLARWYDRRP